MTSSAFVPTQVPRRRLLKIAMYAVGAALGATLLMGVLHLPFARPLLAKLQGLEPDSCPMGWTKTETLTPAAVETRRAAMLTPTRGDADAKDRPALGFAFEKTTRADVDAWASKHGITCRADRHNAGLDCPGVPAEALPEPRFFRGQVRVMPGFDANQKLVSLQLSAAFPDAQSAADKAVELIAELERGAGPTTARSGEPTVEHLTRNVLAQSRAEWKLRNYDARVLVTNMAKHFLMDVVVQTVPDA